MRRALAELLDPCLPHTLLMIMLHVKNIIYIGLEAQRSHLDLKPTAQHNYIFMCSTPLPNILQNYKYIYSTHTYRDIYIYIYTLYFAKCSSLPSFAKSRTSKYLKALEILDDCMLYGTQLIAQNKNNNNL